MHSFGKVWILVVFFVGVTMAEVKSVNNQISQAQVNPIITELLQPLGSAIEPLLGPFAPLSDILKSIITQSVTDMVTSMLNSTLTSAIKQETEQIKGFTRYLITIPNRGKFVFLKSNNFDANIEDGKGTIDEFMMKHPTLIRDRPSAEDKLQIIKGKKQPVLKKNVSGYLIPLDKLGSL